MSSEKIQEYIDLIDSLSDRIAGNFYQTIQVLSAIACMHEKFYIGGHSKFVSQKAKVIAEMMSLPETDVFEIEIAGLLHDIGKIRFDDALNALNTYEMSENEYAQYTMHPEIGRQILEKHDDFRNIADIIYQHHEKLDGSGFPQHLSREQIHIGAQIIAVVDTYHTQFYKQSKDQTRSVSSLQFTSPAAFMESTKVRFAAAMNYLNQKAGKLFDKKIVKLFTELIEAERKSMGGKTVLRVPVNQIESGMIFAEDYYTSFGLLIAGRGETISEDSKKALVKFAEHGDIPMKILVMK